MEIKEKMPSVIKNAARVGLATAALSGGALVSTNENSFAIPQTNPYELKLEDNLQKGVDTSSMVYKVIVGGIARDGADFPTEFGFNTHLYANAEPDNLDVNRFKKTVDELVANNQSWIRFNIPRWEGSSLLNGKLLWNEEELKIFDEAIDYTYNKGLQTFLVVSPPSVEANFSKDGYTKITHDYFTTLAMRYKDKINIWQINNEIDLHSPADYSENTFEKRDQEFILSHVRAASDAIRAIDPNATITVNVSGWPMNDKTQENWEKFIEPLLPYINVVSLDLYPDGNTEEIKKLPIRVEEIRRKFKLPIYISETGICTVGCDLNNLTQKDIITQTIHELLKARPNAIIIYEYTDELKHEDFPKRPISDQVQGSFGVTRMDGSKNPGFEEIIRAMQPQFNKVANKLSDSR